MENLKLTDDELVMLDALVQGPGYTAIKKIVDQYKAQVMSELLTCSDPSRIFQIQGRLVGVEACFNLPKLLADQHKLRKQAQAKRA